MHASVVDVLGLFPNTSWALAYPSHHRIFRQRIIVTRYQLALGLPAYLVARSSLARKPPTHGFSPLFDTKRPAVADPA